MRQLHQRYFQQQSGIGCMPHLDQHLAQAFHGPHQSGGTQARRLLGHHRSLLVGQGHQFGRHQRQEAVAQVADDVFRQAPGIAALLHGERNRGEGTTRIELDQCFDELVELHDVDLVAVGRRRQFQRAERVASRTAALFECAQDGRIADLQASIADHPAHMRLELVHGQQVEPEVQRAAANGLADLLRIGGGQHEHHMRGWLFQRLQQRGLGLLGQHVHLVEDVHLVATGGAQRRLFDQVAHGIDAVVAGGVELVHVVAGTALDGDARLAFAAGLAIDRPLAVQHLGKDARRGGLAGTTRAGEQICLRLALVDDRVAQGLDDVVLPAHFTEPAWAVAAIQGLSCHCDRAYGTCCGPSTGVETRRSGETGHDRARSVRSVPAVDHRALWTTTFHRRRDIAR